MTYKLDRRFLCYCYVSMSVLVFASTVNAALRPKTPPTRPNILVVLCDDLGYGDLACYGHPKLKTPNVDAFAKQGLKLTSCYAAASNCSPARTGLMTGRTPYRAGIYNWIPMFSPMHVRSHEITIATLLRQAGYATCHVGKWHLNGRFNLEGQPQPSDHGFDYWFSTQNNALPNHGNPFNFVRNGKPVGRLKGYAAKIVVDEAIGWLAERDKSKPFFLYVCIHEPHEPIATAPEFAKLYPSDDPSYTAHHGNITQMDHAFGRLMRTLDEKMLSKDTFVFFTSDNGPAITSIHPHGSAGPLRDKKGALYEGGIRVPGILRWPEHTQSGTTSDVPISGVDLLPTLCDLTGTKLPPARELDGASFLPVIAKQPMKRNKPLYWQFNYARSKPKAALRIGDWKIVGGLKGGGLKPTGHIQPSDMRSIKESELADFELYNLKSDIGETTDLSKQEPDRLRQMVASLRSFHAEVRADCPDWPEWEWPRYESQKIEWPAYRRRK